MEKEKRNSLHTVTAKSPNLLGIRRVLKIGDRVFIDGTQEEGTVKDVHGRTIIVKVGNEERRYVPEDLRLDVDHSKPTHFRDKSKYGEHNPE